MKQKECSKFDKIIKNKLLANEKEETFGYVVNGTEYLCYYNQNEFEKFKTEMEIKYPAFYRAYTDGKGSELIERKNRGKIYPPKMASVASSSRFCYLALRNGAEALGWERRCPCRAQLPNQRLSKSHPPSA